MVQKHDPDTVHLRLRVDGKLLRKLEQAAKRANRSLNNEVVTRLDASFHSGGEDRVEALADQMAEMRRELDAIKLGAAETETAKTAKDFMTNFGSLPDEEVERRRKLSVEATKMTAEEIEEVRREFDKAIEEGDGATTLEELIKAIKGALRTECGGKQQPSKRAKKGTGS